MEDEAVCWNCGQPTGVVPAETRPATDQGLSGDWSLSAVVIYTGLTVAVVVGALLLTAFLGSRPRLQAAGVQPPDDWQQVTDEDETFTLFL
ncbi:MAG: hypothetical protein GWN87_10605, partial [Desulfuromonadales bacterium]|nr:hypothetical protein [Desulfuromonadales bacterium]NIS40915.1 hypothetical protein [Desulfuromonadales bacterium]